MARQTYCYIVIFYFHHFWEKNKTLLIYLLWICPRELWGGVFCVLSPRLCPSPYHTPATGQGQQSGWAGTWRWPMGHCEAGRKGSGEWSFQWSLVKETEQVLFKFMSVNHALQGLKWLLNSLLSNHSVTQKEPDTQGTAVLWKFILLHFVHHSFSHYLRRSNGKPWLDDGDQQCWLASRHHRWTHCSNHPQLSQKPQPTKDSLQHLCLFHLTAATPFKNSCNKNYSHCVVQPLLLPKCCNALKLKRVIAAVLNPKGILCHIFCRHPLKPESWNNCKLEK